MARHQNRESSLRTCQQVLSARPSANAVTSSCSVGSRDPGAIRPRAISVAIRSTTSLVRLRAGRIGRSRETLPRFAADARFPGYRVIVQVHSTGSLARSSLEPGLETVGSRTAERTLKDENLEDHVRSLRRIFQGTFRDEAIAVVERLTGRRVLAFLSDHAVNPDYAVEAFILDPGLKDAPGE